MRVAAIVLVGLVLCGCSSKVFLPYESETLCSKGPGGGMCGSVTQVYHETRRLDGRE